ncbi:MAG TPA: hypothetical protein VHO24_07680 [Opitutaceae bacterium]|nr:hypothetical protein [Opitutaceae bacterium]
MPPEITLVHGTFQPKAKWTMQESSELCAYLRGQFGEGVTFHRFEWSGKNSHAERLKAAGELGAILRTRLDQPGAAPQFVIGHSHGGTVLAYAVHRDPDLQKRLAGIVLLGTPFIHVRRRPLGPALLLPVLVAAFFVLLRGFRWCNDSLGSFTAEWHWLLGWAFRAVVGLGLMAVFLLMIGIVLGVLVPGKKGLPDWLEKRIAAVVRSFRCDHLPVTRTLIVRSNGDEASSGLAVLQVLSRLLGDLSSWLARLLYLPVRLFRTAPAATPAKPAKPAKAKPAGFWDEILIVLGLVVLMFLINGRNLLRKISFLGAPMDWLDRLGGWLNAMMDGIYDVMNLLVFVLLAQLLLITPFVILLVRGFGLPPSLFAFFVDIVVEVTPPGRWEVHQMDRPEMAARWTEVNPLELSHSSSYGDPRVHALIHRWIAERAGNLSS